MSGDINRSKLMIDIISAIINLGLIGLNGPQTLLLINHLEAQPQT